MLGGVEVTDKARAHARDMLNAAERSSAARATGTDTTGDTVSQPRPPAARRR
jgi:hypothetical protein